MSKMTFYSWQQTAVTVPANDWIEITFDQQIKPNIFLIKNYGKETLEVGFTFVPHREKKDKTIYPTSDDIIGSPVPREKIFINNSGAEECAITIYSDFMEKFDWTVLKNTTNAYIQGIAPDVRIDTDHTDIVEAIHSKHHELSQILMENHGDLMNHLGTTSNDDLIPLLNTHHEELMERLSKVTKLIPIAGFIASNSAGSNTFTDVHSVNFIGNDGDNDITLLFGMDSVFTLKPGEVLTDIKALKNNTFEIQSMSAFNVRYFYYRKEEV